MFKEWGDVTVKDARTPLETLIYIISVGFKQTNKSPEIYGVARKPILANTHMDETQVSWSFEKAIQALENNGE